MNWNAVSPTKREAANRWPQVLAADLSRGLEGAAESLHLTLEQVWTRVQKFSAGAARARLVLSPKQEQLIQLLLDHKAMASQKHWAALEVTKLGVMKLMQPLLDAGFVQRIGTQKTGRYVLA